MAFGWVRGSTDRSAGVYQCMTTAKGRILMRVTVIGAGQMGRGIGTRVVAGGNDGMRLWDVATGAELAKMTGHAVPVWGLASFPDGTRAVSASNDWTLRVWDLEIAERAKRGPRLAPGREAPAARNGSVFGPPLPRGCGQTSAWIERVLLS